jgi:hypothetical protein
MNADDYPTARRLRQFFHVKSDATALRLGLKPFPTQGSRSSNPGPEGVTALVWPLLNGCAEIARTLMGLLSQMQSAPMLQAEFSANAERVAPS